jgi:hypothetical protein
MCDISSVNVGFHLPTNLVLKIFDRRSRNFGDIHWLISSKPTKTLEQILKWCPASRRTPAIQSTERVPIDQPIDKSGKLQPRCWFFFHSVGEAKPQAQRDQMVAQLKLHEARE